MSAVLSRDGRCANRMDEESRTVHQRLEGWARWAKSHLLSAYPSTTILARMIECGVVGAAAMAGPIEIPEAVAETDAAVKRLPMLEREAIYRYYLYWEPIEVTAKALNLVVRDLQRLLQRARIRISTTISICTRA